MNAFEVRYIIYLLVTAAPSRANQMAHRLGREILAEFTLIVARQYLEVAR